jgi:hypothetical protein
MLKRTFTASVIVATLAMGASSAGALDHPGHEQADRGNGPAANDIGEGRGNPNGANGTIKIDGAIFDGHPNNEPHIAGCGFEVDFYGFDEGDTADLTFYQWPGTGNKSQIQTSTNIDVGGDGAGGGIDIDAQQFVVLTGDLGKAHPRHGYHIRAEAEITSGDRVYTKTKVFWITGDCVPPTGSGPDPT